MTLTKQQRRQQVQNGMAKNQRSQKLAAEIGRLDDDGGYTVYANKTKNIVYARLIKDNNRLVDAYCITLDPRARMPVWIERTTDGYEVQGLRPKDAGELYGQAAPPLNSPTKPGEYMIGSIGGRNIDIGLVSLAAEGTLVFQIKPFRYWWNGAEVLWPGGAYDASGDLPSTSAYWHWGRLAIDPTDNSATIVTGTEYASITLLTEDELNTLDMSGLIPLDGVKLQNGATTVTNPDYFYFARSFVNAGPDFLHNLTATTNPGTGDDTDDGYAVGSRWVNTSLDLEFVCLDATATAAVWKCTTITKSTADVSNPPTDAELDSAFGAPSGWPLDALIILDDNGGETNPYLIWSTGSAWFYVAGTVAS